MVGEEEVIFRTCFLFVSVMRQGRLVAMYELLVSEGGGVVWVWPGFGRVYTMFRRILSFIMLSVPVLCSVIPLPQSPVSFEVVSGGTFMVVSLLHTVSGDDGCGTGGVCVIGWFGVLCMYVGSVGGKCLG